MSKANATNSTAAVITAIRLISYATRSPCTSTLTGAP
jgi:hypothetical protein